MAFIIENLRLKELALVTEQNRPAFDDLVGFLRDRGYSTLHAFVIVADYSRAFTVIHQYLIRPLPTNIHIYDGVARTYAEQKGKWLLMGWILRDAPEQRLRPMLASMPGANALEKQANLLNAVRLYVASIYPDPAQWDWIPIAEVIADRLEGSRRAIKGTLFEAIVRRHLADLFGTAGLALQISDSEIRLGGETYDVQITGRSGRILLPVKTRETMGGGHALLFTRDIHKSISVAHEAGFECLPIIIAESWAGNLGGLTCRDHIYINMNPNQIVAVEPALATELSNRVAAFRSIT